MTMGTQEAIPLIFQLLDSNVLSEQYRDALNTMFDVASIQLRSLREQIVVLQGPLSGVEGES